MNLFIYFFITAISLSIIINESLFLIEDCFSKAVSFTI